VRSVNREKSIYSRPIACRLARSLTLYPPRTSQFTRPPTNIPHLCCELEVSITRQSATEIDLEWTLNVSVAAKCQ